MEDNNQIYQESVKEKLVASPIEKYIKYNRFPIKMLIHVLLTITTTIAVISISKNLFGPHRNDRGIWFDIVKVDPSNPAGSDLHLYGTSEFIDHFNTSLLAFNNTKDIVYQTLINPPIFYIDVNPLYPGSFLLDKNFDSNTSNTPPFIYNLSLTDGVSFQKPFSLDSPDSIKYFIQRVNSFSLVVEDFNLRSTLNKRKRFIDTCFKLILFYNVVSYSHIIFSFESYEKLCDVPEDNDLYSPLSIKNNRLDTQKPEKKIKFDSMKLNLVFILILAVFSTILNWKYFYEIMNLYMDTRIRSRFKAIKNSFDELSDEISYLPSLVGVKGEKSIEKIIESQKPWDKLSFREKLFFFDLWFVFCMIGNLIQIWGSILSLANELSTSNKNKQQITSEILIGFSCWFSWLNLLRYLEYHKNIHLLTNVMRNSGPQIIRFLVGIVPIFMGYVVLGVCLFWKSEKFKSINEAIITLFSIMMGDFVYATFSDEIGIGLLGQLYLFSFILIFIICVHNIFVSIICSKAIEKKKEQPFICDACRNLQPKPKSKVQSPKQTVDPKTNSFFSFQSEEQIEKLSSDDKEGSKVFLDESIRKNTTLSRRTTFIKKDFVGLAEKKRSILNKIAIYRRQITILFDEMRKEAIEDLDFFNLKSGEKLAIKRKYKQQMEYLKSKIKLMIEQQ